MKARGDHPETRININIGGISVAIRRIRISMGVDNIKIYSRSSAIDSGEKVSHGLRQTSIKIS